MQIKERLGEAHEDMQWSKSWPVLFYAYSGSLSFLESAKLSQMNKRNFNCSGLVAFYWYLLFHFISFRNSSSSRSLIVVFNGCIRFFVFFPSLQRRIERSSFSCLNCQLQAGNTKESMCHLCAGTFSRKRELQRHISSVHERKKNFPCDVCGKALSDVSTSVAQNTRPRNRQGCW